jgi:hypothetical protein
VYIRFHFYPTIKFRTTVATMKVSNVLPLIALLLVPATASAIIGTVDSLDHATDSNINRFLKKEKESKGTKKKKGKKATKTLKTQPPR